MLPDKKLDSLDAHLEHFKQQDRARQIDLNSIITEYSHLLNEYKVLKRAHEDQITKAIAKPVPVSTLNVAAATKPRDSYVIVLVDGNDYIFNDEFISESKEGGMRAARKLNDAIDRYLDQNVPDALSRRVIVRIYANVTNLSKQLGKLKLTGQEKRSVADFTAGFTRAMSWFDFIDTLDEEGTKFKIREQFKVASEDTACSHILFAACSDPAYLSQFFSYNGPRDKITLVQGSRWHPDFHQFNFEVTQFPTVFSWSGIPPATLAEKTPTQAAPKPKTPVQQPVQQPTPKPGLLALRKESWRRNDSASLAESATNHLSLVPTTVLQSTREDSWRRNAPASVTESAFGDSSPVETNDFVDQEPQTPRWDSPPPRDQATPSVANGHSNDALVCKYYKRGACRYESSCKYSHGPQSLDGHGSGSQVSKPLLSPTLQSLSGSSFSVQAPVSSLERSEMDRSGIASCLPQESVPGFIPLNKFSQRLDPYIPEPTASEYKAYNSRFQRVKPCNTYQLQGKCNVADCTFDHSELEPVLMHVLRYVVKRIPCSRKGACRRADCTHGHLCQKEDCIKAKGHGPKRCKFRPEQHYTAEECKLGSLVPVEATEEHTETAVGNQESGLTVNDLVAMEEVDLLW